jgi:class 3 adenylate cyclase
MSEYGPGSSPYEVLVHLSDRILSGELRTFQALKSHAGAIADSPRGKPILKKAFDLQRQLYWGFFRELSPQGFHALWNQVVMPDPDFDFAGDLKGYMSIPDIYVGLVDIHGYTRFCHENRNNMSMLDLLDRTLHEDVRGMAAKCGVLARRARGDEVLMLAASAADLAETVLSIMDFFSKRRRIHDDGGGKGAPFDMLLPAFQVSAGLAGGQKFTPLVITRDGDLSGDIVNTAARLQARATRLSPNHNRILVTSHVQQKLAGVDTKKRHHLAEVRFLNTGSVSFKGVNLLVYDAVFLKTEAWRLDIQGELEELYASIEKSMWRSKVFDDALRLAARLAKSLPVFSIPGGDPEGGDLEASGFLALIRSAQQDFAEERFETAIASLSELVSLLSLVDGIDEVALEYLSGIAEGYQTIAASFVATLDAEIGANPDSVLGPKEKASFETLRKHSALYQRIVDKARLAVRNRKAGWFRIADECAPAIGVTIESRK